MFHIFIKKIPLVALLGSTLLLTSCIADKPFQMLHEFQGLIEEPEVQSSDDPDIQLVNTEPETTLEQELEALSETGQWGEQNNNADTTADQGNKVVYDFPIVRNKQVEVYLNLFQNTQRTHFQKWLVRSGRYISLMEKELAKAGLPQDLAYLSMIESGYNQLAYSKASAVGLWQFMRATGKQYNLAIDQYVDERRDAEKSTAAAVTFLGDLYQEFGDWHLAVAAYNAGPGKIGKGLKQYKVDNFWDLAKHNYLNLETKRYVPKLIAAIIIARDPEKYGFTGLDYAEPMKYDRIDVGPGMSLDAVAVVSGTDTKVIKELNQELRQGKTPPNMSHYSVKIPTGSKELASNNMERLHSYVSTGYKTHTIRRGETLAAICRQYDINTTTLLKVNNLRSNKLKNGTNLRIPFTTVKYQLLPEGSTEQLAAYKDNLILHRIKKGESISKIAKNYCVPQEMIVNWNGLRSVHEIRAGQQLALYIEDATGKPQSKANTTIAAATNKRILNTTDVTSDIASASGEDSKIPTLTAQKKLAPKADTKAELPQTIQPSYSWYKVKNGDSLWTISRRFNTSTTQIREWNNLKSNTIRPGSNLKVKKV
jgi:membrane-bound lytic murein transglycosylase D